MKPIIGSLLDIDTLLTLDELCHASLCSHDFVIEMIDLQLIHPQGEDPQHWQFDSISLHRVKIAHSFHHDLEINLQGIALALDLLEQIEQLQARVKLLEKLTE
jgi:chaperone modulatory protein CbpM